MHALKYPWPAAWPLFDEADPAAETWVADKATAGVIESACRHLAKDRMDLTGAR